MLTFNTFLVTVFLRLSICTELCTGFHQLLFGLAWFCIEPTLMILLQIKKVSIWLENPVF